MATFKTKTVEIDGETYTVKELSVRQRREVFDQFGIDNDPDNMGSLMVKYGWPDFADSGTEDPIDLPGGVFDDLGNAIADISGMGTDGKGEGASEEKKP